MSISAAIRFTKAPTSKENEAVHDAMAQMFSVLAQTLPQRNHFSLDKDHASYTFSSIGENNSYRYVRNVHDIKTTDILFTGVPLHEDFTQMDNKWCPQLDALEIPKSYTICPGVKNQMIQKNWKKSKNY